MNNLHQHTLEYLAARHAQALIQATQNDKAKPADVENIVTKTLGVLQENGVYACFLYLYARESTTGEGIVVEALHLFAALKFPAAPNASSKEDTLHYVAEKITRDLATLLLAKDALEQMLIYARYGAKARQKESKVAA